MPFSANARRKYDSIDLKPSKKTVLRGDEQIILDTMKKTVERFSTGFQSELFVWASRGLEFSVDPEKEKIFIYRKSFDSMDIRTQFAISKSMRESAGVEIIDKIPSQSEELKRKILDYFAGLQYL